MELDAVDGAAAVLYCHDLIFLRAGNHAQGGRNGPGIGGKGMVAGHRDLFRKPKEEGAGCVQAGVGLFAVHKAIRVGDGCAEDFTDDLMAQADSENGDPAGKGSHGFTADPGVCRPAGTWRQDDPVRG